MINVYAFFSQVIIWSMTFFLTSQVIFNEETKSSVLAIIPISFSLAAIISPILMGLLPSINNNRKPFFILSAIRIITILPIFFIRETNTLLLLYFVQCVFFHSSFPYEVSYISSHEHAKTRKKTSAWQISISVGKLSSPIVTAYIISHSSLVYYSYTIIAFCFLLLCCSFFINTSTPMHSSQKNFLQSFKEINKYKQIVYRGLYFIPISLAASLYGVLIKDCGLNESGFAVILAISGIGNIVGSTIYGNIKKVNNSQKCVIFHSSLVGVGFILFGLAKSTAFVVAILYSSAFIVGISISLMAIFMVEIIQKNHTDTDLITASSLNNGSQVGFSIVGPAILPLLYKDISASMIFVACGITIIAINIKKYLLTTPNHNE